MSYMSLKVSLASVLLAGALVRPAIADTLIDRTALASDHPHVGTSSLLAGMQFSKVVDRVVRGYTVSSASLLDARHSPAGELVMVTRGDGTFIALVDTPGRAGTVIGKPDGTQRFEPEPEHNYHAVDTEPTGDDSALLKTSSALADTDADGVHVIDVLAGFSRAAADRIEDPEAFALAQIESANLGLRNSNVANARLRLVGIQVIEEDYPISTGSNGTLGKVSTLFADGMERYGADLVAGYFNGGSGGNTAEGWAYVPGRYSIQHVRSPKAFRHEVGHNAGGSHCNTGQSHHRFGFAAGGNSQTLLCGNKISYYSTPLVSDELGRPLGHAATADMARVWRERAAAMSAYAKAVVPIE